jgi:tetratricopeptide (TPR) repeat protein
LRELVRYEEAEQELEFCLEETMSIPEKKRNAQFEEIELNVVTTLATLKQAQSKYPEAMEMYDRALPMARANKEKHSRVWLANHVASCAEVYRKSGDLEKARVLHAEALEYRELAVAEKEGTALELALSFNQLGCTLAGLGEHTEAYSFHRKALSARVENLDFNHGLVSESLNYCADALQALGRGNEGIPLGMHAVRIRKFVFGPHHPAYAHALSVLASCFHSVGRSHDSLGLLEECLEICEGAFSKNHANMIPNLMLYGNVLKVSGAHEQARTVYDRALSIHRMNFKEGQNTKLLEKLQKAMDDLRGNGNAPQSSDLSPQMPTPAFDVDSSMTHVIVCANVGHRASDEYMLSVASSLQTMGTLKLMAVVSVGPSQEWEAETARGALDSLLLSKVPVASGRDPTAEGSNAPMSSTRVCNTGEEIITRLLLQAPEKSLVILCTACMKDISAVITANRDLFASKVKQVVVIGSVKPIRRKSTFVEPEVSSGGDASDAENASHVYKSCQEMKIPTATLFNDVSRGFPFASTHVDNLTTTNHMVATKVQRMEEMHANGIWEMVKQNGPNAPITNFDVKSYCKYAVGRKKIPSLSQHTIWPLIRSINLELTLGLLCCVPIYQDTYFRWETHSFDGVENKICRHTSAATGMIKPEALSNEIHMLIGFALRTSLLNTSC